MEKTTGSACGSAAQELGSVRNGSSGSSLVAGHGLPTWLAKRSAGDAFPAPCVVVPRIARHAPEGHLTESRPAVSVAFLTVTSTP